MMILKLDLKEYLFSKASLGYLDGVKEEDLLRGTLTNGVVSFPDTTRKNKQSLSVSSSTIWVALSGDCMFAKTSVTVVSWTKN